MPKGLSNRILAFDKIVFASSILTFKKSLNIANTLFGVKLRMLILEL